MTKMVNFKKELQTDIASAFNVHDCYKHLSQKELIDISKKEANNFAVACINLTGNVNISTIIRTALLYGAKKVIVFGRKQFDARGLVGADNYIDIDFVPCINNTDLSLDNDKIVEKLKEENANPILIEQGGIQLGKEQCLWSDILSSIHLNTLILGNEGRGIGIDTMNAIFNNFHATIVSIPQKGVLRSHNVSVAAGVVMSNMCIEMGWV